MVASVTIARNDRILKLLIESFPNFSIATRLSRDDSKSLLKMVAQSDEKPVEGTNTIANYLSKDVFPAIKYSDIEQAEIYQWLSLSATQIDEVSGPSNEFLKTLNEHLKTRTTLLGERESVADVALYVRLSAWAKKWTSEERTGGTDGGLRYIVRFMDWVENSFVYGPLNVKEADKIKFDVTDVKTRLKIEEPVKEKKENAVAGAGEGKKGKKEKKGALEAVKETVSDVVTGVTQAVVTAAQVVGVSVPASVPPTDAAAAAAAAASTTPAEGAKKKEKQKKEKPAKPAQPPKEETPLNPSLIDLRVGQILKCVPHPNADSLYMSTVACGDAPGSPYINPYPDGENQNYPPTRTVLSGLKGKIPIEEMQGRRVVLVCNLKPSALRGIKSYAMVLAASPKSEDEAGKLELVSPPEDAKIGERIVFENYEEVAPEVQLNPKKKIWEAIQPGYTTNEKFEVIFNGDVVFNGKEGEQTDTKLNRGHGRLVAQGTRSPCKVVSLVGASVR